MESSISYILPTPPVFSGEDYHIWSAKMRTYLLALDLWEFVSSGKEPSPLKVEYTEADLKQYRLEVANKFKALYIIQNSVSDAILMRIITCTNPKQAWDKLEEEFQMSEGVKKLHLFNLKREFENLIMSEEDESIKQYADRIKTVWNDMKILGDTIYTERRVMEKIVYTLPEKYEPTISSIENGLGISKISLSELLDALYPLELRRANRKQQSIEVAMMAIGDKKG